MDIKNMIPISNGARKTIFIFGVLSFFVIASTAYAQAFVPLAPIPDLTQGATTDSSGLANFLNNLYKYAIGLAAAIAVIQIVWAGLDIAIWHKDAVSNITSDKEKIYNALFGLILVLSPVLVFSIINPSILNLSLNLPPLQTTTAALPGGAYGTPTSSIDSETGCMVTGKSYLLTAVCSSNGTTDALTLADTWGNNNCTLLVDDTASPTCVGGNPCNKATVSCEKKSDSSYTFINIGTNSLPKLASFDDQTNSALSTFINGCNGDGGNVCINQTLSAFPLIGSGTSCPRYTTSLPQGAQGKCYNQSLFCFNQADAAIANGLAISNFTNLSHNYTCQPVLQFATQPIK